MGTPSTAEPSEETSSTEEVAPGQLSADQEPVMYLGIAHTRRDMLAGREDALAKVEFERRLVLLAGRGFDRAVCEARAEGNLGHRRLKHGTLAVSPPSTKRERARRGPVHGHGPADSFGPAMTSTEGASPYGELDP